MRVAVLDQYYLRLLETLYRDDPSLAAAPYDAQMRAIMAVHFGTADAYTTGFRAAGHEAADLLVNVLPLQARWAAEHGVAPVARTILPRLPLRPQVALSPRFLRSVVRAQLEQLDPDVVYLQDFWFLDEAWMRALRAEGRLVVGQLGSVPPADGRVAACDLVLTSFPHFVGRLREQGIDCAYFPIAFDDRVLSRPELQEVPRDVGASFVGTIHPPDVHRAGTALFERLCTEVDLQMWGFVNDRVAADSPIRANHHGEAWGVDMYRVLARSRIVVNRHGDIAEGHANNMRLFEATGMGALLLTEAAPNLPELFAPGVEVVAYDGADDLVTKVRYYLAHEDERAAIAAAGQARTLREHTYARRIAELTEILEARLG